MIMSHVILDFMVMLFGGDDIIGGGDVGGDGAGCDDDIGGDDDVAGGDVGGPNLPCDLWG